MNDRSGRVNRDRYITDIMIDIYKVLPVASILKPTSNFSEKAYCKITPMFRAFVWTDFTLKVSILATISSENRAEKLEVPEVNFAGAVLRSVAPPK